MPSNKNFNPYKFSLLSSLYITLGAYFVINYNDLSISIESVLVSSIIFGLSFIVIQLRVRKLFFERIRQIYKDLEFETDSLIKTSAIDPDMNSFSNDLEEFVKLKRTEIETLKKEDIYRKEFVGNVAHELKTPLFSVQGYISNLLDGAMDDKELLKKYLKRAEKSVDRLTFIIKDLDLITQLESSTLKLEIISFDIVELAQEIIDDLEISASRRNIKIIFDKNYDNQVLVKADRNRIEQVISNLITNSINYGSEKGTTEISFESKEEKIIVKVNDNGEGISKENMPRLFQRFFRVDESRSRSQGGSGLGLAIVKHIIDAHNENIYVQSTVGIGSEFSFSLKKSKVL
nr:two-component system sensor histidine kinase [uncultured bacterium]|tara:strand:- start:7315 stop:8352 length:1038 start_codon:yes stop_codon:yes gene_type:complete